jgi:hypothetical protein
METFMSENRKLRHTPEQVISKLRSADNAGGSTAEVLQEPQVSEAAQHICAAQCGGMKSDAM